MISYAFAPSVGGIESSSELLAAEFDRMGHAVCVVSAELQADDRERRFPVVRTQDFRVCKQVAEWSDVVIQNNVSIRSLWIARLVRRRKTVVILQTWFSGTKDKETVVSAMKRRALKGMKVCAVSGQLAKTTGRMCRIVGNPYDPYVFRSVAGLRQRSEFIFVGRLVTDKGVDLAIRALAAISHERSELSLTVIGDGPERKRCEALAEKLSISKRVRFLGAFSGKRLAFLLQAHRVLVVPSLWAEPFGIVALEGLASGCIVVGSVDGGLGDAMGCCGFTFDNGDPEALAAAMLASLNRTVTSGRFQTAADNHVRKYSPAAIAGALLKILEDDER